MRIVDGITLHLLFTKPFWGKKVVNDEAERSHGAGSRELQIFGCIILSKAFGMGHAKIQGDFSSMNDGFLFNISEDEALAD